MARGKKSYTLEEQLEKISSEIEKMEASIKELKSTKKEIEEKIKQQRLSELDELITSSGKSIEDIKELLVTTK